MGAVAMLAGCGNLSGESCGGEAAQDAVKQLLLNATADGVRSLLDESSQLGSFDRGKLDAGLARMTVEFADVRTLHDDPDSSRMQCAAKISISYPQSVWRTIDHARTGANAEDRQTVLNRAGITHDASSFSDEFEYSIQPTDDGETVIAEADGDAILIEANSELFATYLLSDEIRRANIESDRQEAEAQAEARAQEEEMAQLAAEEEAAYEDYVGAVLAEVQEENRLAAQTIAATWQAIPQDRRQQMAAAQNAWNARTTAQCRLQAAGTSTERDEIRANQLRCETQAILNRARELERYLPADY